jgi:hypothetical protein
VVGHAANLEKAVQDFPGVELDGVLPMPAQALKDLVDDSDLLSASELKTNRGVLRGTEHTISASGIIGSYTP